MKTVTRKTPTLKALAHEVSLLRSFIIGAAGRDNSEGAYQPDFVENMLSVAEKASPRREFVGAGEFLRRLRHTAQ